MITSDVRTPCVTVEAIRSRLHQGVRGGAAADISIADAIDDARSASEAWLSRRIDPSEITEAFAPAITLTPLITPVISITSVTSGGQELHYSFADGVITLTALPTADIEVMYAAGLQGIALETAAGVIKRAAVRIVTNPSGVIQSGGPGQPFYPEAGGVQAIITKSERDTLRTCIPLWGVA